MRYFLLCQVHGWFDTVSSEIRANELRDEHCKLHQYENDDGRWDGEILIAKEQE